MDLTLLVVYGVFANGSDLDFIPWILLGNPSVFHHGLSHSLGFGIIFALGFSVILVKFGERFSDIGLVRLALTGYLLYVSYLLLALVTPDNTAPLGLSLFWPIRQLYVHAPAYLLPNIMHPQNVLSIHNFSVALREISVFAPVAVYLLLVLAYLSDQMKRLWSLGLTVYLGVMVALFTRPNPNLLRGK